MRIIHRQYTLKNVILKSIIMIILKGIHPRENKKEESSRRIPLAITSSSRGIWLCEVREEFNATDMHSIFIIHRSLSLFMELIELFIQLN